jgi:nicotinamide phosphoribosyltransferase
MRNLLLATDSYKASHWKQYPKGMEGYFGYIESRGSEKEEDPYSNAYRETVFFGLQIFLQELAKPITMEMIEEAEQFFTAHGEPFNKEGWEYILNKHDGYIPVKIKAVPEGTVVPLRNALVTVEVLDPVVAWVGSYLETALLRAVWYPTTVATNSYYCKKVIKKYLDISSTDPEGQILFKLHDFGGRGVSSGESAAIGGAAHLVNFMGSDTVEGVFLANKVYKSDMSAFSIPAAEHSTITCWGKDNEIDAYRNMLKQYAKPGALVACVSDSYDIFYACEKIWGEQLKQEVIDSEAIIVIRPDSGDPTSVVLKCVRLLGEKFGYETNDKGFKVLNNVRVIQGDGINRDSIDSICNALVVNQWSIDNVAFGMGGALLQQLNRDTLKFAMKCSAVKINGDWIDVFKDPITDSGKKSKKGRISLFKEDNKFYNLPDDSAGEEVLQVVFDNGKIVKEYTLDEVRANSQK